MSWVCLHLVKLCTFVDFHQEVLISVNGQVSGLRGAPLHFIDGTFGVPELNTTVRVPALCVFCRIVPPWDRARLHFETRLHLIYFQLETYIDPFKPGVAPATTQPPESISSLINCVECSKNV